MDAYRTLARNSEGLLKEKGSRFLSFAYPMDNVESAEAQIEKMRKTYFDSRHVCFAWRFGPEGNQARAYDAGEPMHSAGVPILNQIRSFELTQVLVVVVRYFGGTQLGLPGLIAAYQAATAEAIRNNEIIEKVVLDSFRIAYPYEQTARVNQLIHRHKAEIIQSDFGESCKQTLGLRPSIIDSVRKDFSENGIFIEN
jgi:uncharacterized YigZ family protein